MKSTTGTRLFTPQEAAEYLRIPPATLSVWRTRREGPDYIKVGAHVRYDMATLNEWLESRRVHH